MNFTGPPAASVGIEEINKDSNFNASELPYDQWVPLPISDLKPSARYKHAAAVAGEKLYVIGGSRNGRSLSDIQVFDLRTLVWSTLKPYQDLNPEKPANGTPLDLLAAPSGHSLVRWGNKLLVVAGHSKESFDTVTVRSVDIETPHCYVLKTSGKIPVAREGQSVTLVGSKLIMFGGEDVRRQLLNDLYVLDLETMMWAEVETVQTPPAPRFDHIAAVHADRYLLIFGGCSHSACFNDLHVLDLQSRALLMQSASQPLLLPQLSADRSKAAVTATPLLYAHHQYCVSCLPRITNRCKHHRKTADLHSAMEWSQPQIQGEGATARAGHAGATIGENWYIVGGGDNRSGASETLVLNMSKLVWSVLTSVKERDPLASEGLSLCSTSIDGEKLLVAFGGYNGKYNNEVFVLKPKPRDLSRPKIFQSPAAAAAAASVTAAYALTTTTAEKLNHITMEDAPLEEVKTEISPSDVTVDINTIREEKKMLELKLAEVRIENSRLQGVLDETNSNHVELSKELHSVHGQVESERSRCFKLEVQIAELQKRLESLDTLEHELRVLQQQRSASEQEMEEAAAAGQRPGGVWRWIAG